MKPVFQVRTYQTPGFPMAVVAVLGVPCTVLGAVRLAQELHPWWNDAGAGVLDPLRSGIWAAVFLLGLFIVMHRRSVFVSGRLMQMRVGWGRPTVFWGEPLFMHSAGRVTLRKPPSGRGRYQVMVEMEDGSRVSVTEFRDERAAQESYEDIKLFLQGTLYERPAHTVMPDGPSDPRR